MLLHWLDAHRAVRCHTGHGTLKRPPVPMRRLVSSQMKRRRHQTADAIAPHAPLIDHTLQQP